MRPTKDGLAASHRQANRLLSQTGRPEASSSPRRSPGIASVAAAAAAAELEMPLTAQELARVDAAVAVNCAVSSAASAAEALESVRRVGSAESQCKVTAELTAELGAERRSQEAKRIDEVREAGEPKAPEEKKPKRKRRVIEYVPAGEP